jgi:5-hydroxyisourate hydrolase
MGKLTTHVLDTSAGKPADNLVIRLYKKIDDKFEFIKTIQTNSDGRSDEPLLENIDLKKGGYELLFDVEEYFIKEKKKSTFLKDVVIRFYIENEDENYHVPLLISPYSYSTYKGS